MCSAKAFILYICTRTRHRFFFSIASCATDTLCSEIISLICIPQCLILTDSLYCLLLQLQIVAYFNVTLFCFFFLLPLFFSLPICNVATHIHKYTNTVVRNFSSHIVLPQTYIHTVRNHFEGLDSMSMAMLLLALCWLLVRHTEINNNQTKKEEKYADSQQAISAWNKVEKKLARQFRSPKFRPLYRAR